MTTPPAAPRWPTPNSITAMVPEMTAWRRDIHAHPELGYQETRTAALVAEKLGAFGFDAVETGIGGTGVIGVLHGAGGPGAGEAQAILIRADMDALPMPEETGLPHASTNPGKMHACGHDGHTTMLLGAAKHLAETRNFHGTVYFCFQPAEEGGAGARAMMEDGLFDRFPCSKVFGMHNWPRLPVGEFGIAPGPMMAASDEFKITLTGRGGHAAKPDFARDPIVGGAYLVTQLQTVVSRTVDPLQPAVVTIATFNGGTVSNVIPDKVVISGTVRTFSEEVYKQIHVTIARMVEETSTSFDLTSEIWVTPNAYPPTVNDKDATAFAEAVARDVVGDDKVHTDWPPTMGGEDFAFFAREKPGCFVFCGNGDSAPLHNTKYDFDDAALAPGVAYWTRLVEAALPKG